VHVDDLADAHLRALSKLQQGSPEVVCNLGTGNGFSVREVIEAESFEDLSDERAKEEVQKEEL
jgi:UDP-glucose 4-epimerase